MKANIFLKNALAERNNSISLGFTYGDKSYNRIFKRGTRYYLGNENNEEICFAQVRDLLPEIATELGWTAASEMGMPTTKRDDAPKASRSRSTKESTNKSFDDIKDAIQDMIMEADTTDKRMSVLSKLATMMSDIVGFARAVEYNALKDALNSTESDVPVETEESIATEDTNAHDDSISIPDAMPYIEITQEGEVIPVGYDNVAPEILEREMAAAREFASKMNEDATDTNTEETPDTTTTTEENAPTEEEAPVEDNTNEEVADTTATDSTHEESPEDNDYRTTLINDIYAMLENTGCTSISFGGFDFIKRKSWLLGRKKIENLDLDTLESIKDAGGFVETTPTEEAVEEYTNVLDEPVESTGSDATEVVEESPVEESPVATDDAQEVVVKTDKEIKEEKKAVIASIEKILRDNGLTEYDLTKEIVLASGKIHVKVCSLFFKKSVLHVHLICIDGYASGQERDTTAFNTFISLDTLNEIYNEVSK